jgi:hypothetical protein
MVPKVPKVLSSGAGSEPGMGQNLSPYWRNKHPLETYEITIFNRCWRVPPATTARAIWVSQTFKAET